MSYLVELGLDALREHFGDKVDEHKLQTDLLNYIENQLKYNETVSLSEEIDFQGLVDYIRSELLVDVETSIFSPNQKKRGQARQHIVERACAVAKAETDAKKNAVSKHISACLDIIRDFYSNEIELKDYIIASEIVDAVGEKLDDVSNAQKQDIINAVGEKLDDVSNTQKQDIINAVGEKLDDVSNTLTQNIINSRANASLPFEVKNMIYKAEVSSGKIFYEFGFDVSKENYNVILEDLFVASESKTGNWAFKRFPCFWENTTHQYVKKSSETGGIRKINSSGVVAFIKIYNHQSYYIRVFGNMDKLNYEPLTEDDYVAKRKEYSNAYKNTEKIDSDYDDWRKYYALVMYTDFGH